MSYCRVYHSIIDDAKFAAVYQDDRRLALWLRLLIGADQAYPAPAVLQRSANMLALAHLVEVRLVELVGSDHYRICGLAAERTARSNASRIAARMRWDGSRNAGAYASAMGKTSLTEPSRAKPSQGSAKRTVCPVDPAHDMTLADGKVWCLACEVVLA